LLGPARLRQLALALLAALALAGCGGAIGASGSGDRTGRVEKVSDGDTVRLVGLGRVRLIGVDTPEVYGQSECFGKEASAFVKRLLPTGTTVRYRVGVEPRDRYGRLLAYFWLPDGRFLNLLLAERGYALPLTIPPNVDHAAEFVAAARRARTARRGLWLACDDSQPAR
jgi:micrococcal nuclease